MLFGIIKKMKLRVIEVKFALFLYRNNNLKKKFDSLNSYLTKDNEPQGMFIQTIGR